MGLDNTIYFTPGIRWYKVAKTPKNRDNALAAVDPKGRVVIPGGVRDHLLRVVKRAMARPSRRLVFTQLGEPCIVVYPEAEWEKVEEQLRDLDSRPGPGRAAARLIQGFAESVELDSAGRVVIPGHLAEHAGIKDRALFVKLPRGFEIWSPERYQDWSKDVELPEGLRL